MRYVLAIIAMLPAIHSSLAYADGYPVEIKHEYGSAVIDQKPERIVSLSFIGHDFLLALDEVPVALRYWYGTDPYGVWPWAQDALGDATPIVMQGEIDVERIAALDPDLIVGQWSGMSARDYALLSQIAPTIGPAQGAEDYGMAWQDMLRVLGQATGKANKANQIVNRIETRFADLRDAHLPWQGAGAVMVWAGQVGTFTNRDIRGQFLEELGFVVPDAINEMGSANNFYVLMPPEDISPIDTDLLIWIDAGGSVPKLHDMPLRPLMRAYQEGREIYADPLLSAALSHSSPLSLDYALDRLVPLIEAAIDGDPTTIVPSSEEAGIVRPLNGG
ncbi:MAG: ABC transporter substrate-binding protein [Pseudomonadota bacterium]